MAVVRLGTWDCYGLWRKTGRLLLRLIFDMLLSTITSQLDLDTCIGRFKLTLQQYASNKLPIVGIGHSSGCLGLLVLAGARACTYAGDEIVSNNRSNFAGLVLLAPTVDLFRHPAASVAVNA